MNDVVTKLDGKPVTLRPTLKAARQVSAAGGFQNVVNRLQSGDLEYYILVTAAGLDKSKDSVAAGVYRTGLPALASDLVKFCNLCANGGKPYRAQKLKTVEIEGKTYAEVDDLGEPVYVDEEPAEEAPAGEA